MAITLSTITANEIYGVRSALPIGFSAGGVGEYLKTLTIDLKIWIGDKVTNKPASATYSISLGTNTFGSTLQYYELDISELVREYIDTDDFGYPTTYGSDFAAWVEIDWSATNNSDTEYTGTPTIICTNGFRLYEDSTLALDTYYFPSTVYVPEDMSYFITVLDKGTTGATRVVDEIQIDYSDSTTGTTAFGAADDTTSSLFKTATLTWGANDTEATVNLLLSSSVVYSFTVKKLCKAKYTPKQVGYVNRIGAVDYLYFFGKNEDTQTAERTIYKPSLNNNYDNANAQFRILNANGKRRFTLNTDWVVEETREKVADLILTEYAFLGSGSASEEDVKAITPLDQEQTLKQDNNELSNYTLQFEYAYNHINSVR